MFCFKFQQNLTINENLNFEEGGGGMGRGPKEAKPNFPVAVCEPFDPESVDLDGYN